MEMQTAAPTVVNEKQPPEPQPLNNQPSEPQPLINQPPEPEPEPEPEPDSEPDSEPPSIMKMYSEQKEPNVINYENVQKNITAELMQPNAIENTQLKHNNTDLIIIPSSTNSPSCDLIKNNSNTELNGDVNINHSEINGHAMNDMKNNEINNKIINNESSSESIQIIAYKPSTQIAGYNNDLIQLYNNNNNFNNDDLNYLIQPQNPNLNVLNNNNNHKNDDKKNAEQDEINNINTTSDNTDRRDNKTVIESEQKSENNNNIETTNTEQNNDMDVDEINEINIDLPVDNKCKNENENNNNDFGIGTEQNNEKQEMDIDEDDNINELVPRRKQPQQPQQQQQQNNNPNVQNVKQPTTNTINNNKDNKPFGMMDYDEELDEDFNADEEDDDSSDHSEDILNDGDADDDDSNDLSDLADIDIVNDDKLYTEEAPRWLVNPDEIENPDKQFNIEAAYEDWERDKEAGLYSDTDNIQDHPNDEKHGTLMDYYLTKYCSKQDKRRNTDPEKDKIKKKGGDYRLDDNFIDDGDCFVLNNTETLHCGFFISKGNIDVKKLHSGKKFKVKPPKSSKKKALPDIPRIYQNEINLIHDFVRNNGNIMGHICNNREMNGIINNKHLYMNDNKENDGMYDGHTVDTYHKLLTMLLQFDTTLLRDKAKNKSLSGDLKFAIYHELTPIFGYSPDSYRKQQNTFEELLNWFSYDWYDADDEMQSKKINWRNLFLNELKKRAKARFHNKMNKKRKSNKLGQTSDIPWDGIVGDIFLLTCYYMETAALTGNDIDEARHQYHMSLRESIGKYLEVGNAGITMRDIEKRYKEQKKTFANNGSYCYSYLVIERIKLDQRNEKRHKKPSKKAKRSFREKPVVDLTHNRPQIMISPPPLTPVKIQPNVMEFGAQTQDIKTRPSAGFFAQHHNNNIVHNNDTNNNNTNVIDLTGARRSKSNSMSTTTTIPNTPVPPSKKRRRQEMEAIDAQECTQSQSTQQPLALTSFSPPAKRRKMNENCVVNHDENNDELNEKMYPNPADFMTIGSLIGINDQGSLQNGVNIGVITRKDCERVWYTDYKTEVMSSCEYRLCYLIVPFVDKTPYLKCNDDETDNNVLVLTANSDGSGFNTKYVLAKVTKQPDNGDNGSIGIQYQDQDQEIVMPLFTFIKSAAYQNWESTKIPTVMRIVPMIGSEFANKHKMNEDESENDDNNNDTQSDNKNNGNLVSISCEPPSSNIFCRNLPNDPWNDRHFEGLDDNS